MYWSHLKLGDDPLSGLSKTSTSFELSGIDVSGPCVRATEAVESTVTESVTGTDVETEDTGAVALE